MALNKISKKFSLIFRAQFSRLNSGGGSSSSGSRRKGLVLGIYNEGSGDSQDFKLTSTGTKFNQAIGGKLEDLLKIHGGRIPKGDVQVFQNIESEFYSVAIAGLGSEEVGFNTLENLDECKENVRVAAGAGVRALRAIGTQLISVEGFGQAEAAAEGAALAAWRFQEFKAKEDRKIEPVLELYKDEDGQGWMRGLLKADAQNLARRLSDTPGNIMTPTAFANATVETVCPCGVGAEVRDKEWIERGKFNAFISVARGSAEPPVFIDLSYCGGQPDERPIVLIGKGITFDTGGLFLNKCKPMREFKADMAGAAVVVAVMQAAAALQLPINLQAMIPLCENMPSGMCVKPGDIFIAKNGMSMEVENPDNEGRVIMADVLVHAREFHRPRLIIDVATLTSGMRSALGGGATGVFTNNHDLWREINKAGSITGDRVWRFPLWNHYRRQVTYKKNTDVTNTGRGPGGYPCRGAAFLKEFVTCGDWMHLDITGTGMKSRSPDYPYLEVGRMTGRPTRTLIQLLYQIACPPTDETTKKCTL